MNHPIILWDPVPSTTTDEAGIVIEKLALPPPPPPGPYERTQPSVFSYVPPLTFLCLQKLAPYAHQLDALGDVRLSYRKPISRQTFDLVAALVPGYDAMGQAQHPDLSLVDPRLWAVLVQLYSGLPDAFGSYRIPVSDKHVPLLQRVPQTSHFSLITVLELPGCRKITDRTLVGLKHLNSLSALDVSGTRITANGIRILLGTRIWGEEHDGTRERKGPWGLRILSLRDCRSVDKTLYKYVGEFELLSVLDLRGTRCVADANVPYGFGQADAATVELFYPSPITTSLTNLISKHPEKPLFSSPNIFTLHIDSVQHHHQKDDSLHKPRRLSPGVTMQNSYVFIPPSSQRKMKVGNTDTLARKAAIIEKSKKHENNKAAWYERNADKLDMFGAGPFEEPDEESDYSYPSRGWLEGRPEDMTSDVYDDGGGPFDEDDEQSELDSEDEEGDPVSETDENCDSGESGKSDEEDHDANGDKGQRLDIPSESNLSDSDEHLDSTSIKSENSSSLGSEQRNRPILSREVLVGTEVSSATHNTTRRAKHDQVIENHMISALTAVASHGQLRTHGPLLHQSLRTLRGEAPISTLATHAKSHVDPRQPPKPGKKTLSATISEMAPILGSAACTSDAAMPRCCDIDSICAAWMAEGSGSRGLPTNESFGPHRSLLSSKTVSRTRKSKDFHGSGVHIASNGVVRPSRDGGTSLEQGARKPPCPLSISKPPRNQKHPHTRSNLPISAEDDQLLAERAPTAVTLKGQMTAISGSTRFASTPSEVDGLNISRQMRLLSTTRHSTSNNMDLDIPFHQHLSTSQPDALPEASPTSNLMLQNAAAQEVANVDAARRAAVAFYQRQPSPSSMDPRSAFMPGAVDPLMLYRAPLPWSSLHTIIETMAAKQELLKRQRAGGDEPVAVNRSSAKAMAIRQDMDIWSKRMKLTNAPSQGSRPTPTSARRPVNIFARAGPVARMQAVPVHSAKQEAVPSAKAGVREQSKPIRPISTLVKPPWPQHLGQPHRAPKADFHEASNRGHGRGSAKPLMKGREQLRSQSINVASEAVRKSSQPEPRPRQPRPPTAGAGRAASRRFNWEQWGRGQ